MPPGISRACYRTAPLRSFKFYVEHHLAASGLPDQCEHYAANRQRYIAAARRRKQRIAIERATLLIEILRDRPCADCGECDPLVLEFDHLRDKSFNIAQGLRNHSWQAVLAEIEKCEVVCANCHRRRTARTLGSHARR